MSPDSRIVRGGLLAALSVLAGCGSSHSRPTTSTSTNPVSTTVSLSTSTTTTRARRTGRHPGPATEGHGVRGPGGPGRAAPNGAPGAHHASGAATDRSSARHTTSNSTRPAAFTVTLILHGGGKTTVSACGSSHHYRTYPSTSSISFSGKVTPVPGGQWKVKLHLKACRGGSFTDFAKVDSRRDKHTGGFSGTLSAPAPGHYSVHAVLYLGGRPSTKSLGHHLATY